jgi:4-hydroxy-4-methyl-2-oxoglutarate aldolase
MKQVPISASAASDAMDRLGIAGLITGIRPMTSDLPLAGKAFPVRFVEDDEGPFNDYLEQVPPGSIVVIDAGGRTDVSVWGGLIARDAARLGIRATIVHGACRDVDEFKDSGYSVYARARTPRSGRGVLSSANIGEPISIAGVEIRTGDQVIADGDGIVVIPADRADEVLSLARQITDRDESLARAIRGGKSLNLAREQASASITSDRRTS